MSFNFGQWRRTADESPLKEVVLEETRFFLILEPRRGAQLLEGRLDEVRRLPQVRREEPPRWAVRAIVPARNSLQARRSARSVTGRSLAEEVLQNRPPRRAPK